MLTAQDIQALRKADTIVFYHLPTNRRNGHAGQIQALKRIVKSSGVFTSDQMVPYNIDIDSHITNYGNRVNIDTVTAYYSCGCYRDISSIAGTVAAMLHKNDLIEIHWYRNNDTIIIKEAGLVSDECRLKVYRGKKEYEFLIGKQVGKDNATRMIRQD